MIYYVFIPAVVFVEVLECCVEMLFSVHSVHVHRCCNEFFVVDGAVAISIGLVFVGSKKGFSNFVREITCIVVFVKLTASINC